MKLIIVSNRVCHDEAPHSGGLATAVKDTFETVQGIWIGWGGAVSPSFERKCGAQENLEYRVFSLTEEEYSEYYLGFSNEVLWPVCHSRPDHLRYSQNGFAIYRQVNRKFADEVLACAQEDDFVWVHDYHLLLTAQALRDSGFDGAVGYFHHIPVPSPDLIRTIPVHAQLLAALLAFDIVGLQTRNDLKNLLDYFQAERSRQPEMQIIQAGEECFHLHCRGRSTQFGVYPISVDTQRIEDQAPAVWAGPAVQELRQSLGMRPLVLGVDRLDYSKGLEHKFQAFAEYLGGGIDAQSPVLLQIASRTRSALASYQQLCTALEAQASCINGRHGTPSYTPVRYVNTVYAQDQLMGFYRLARVGLVTPVRDGMNLVAKEYVAAQDPDDPGVLVLSEFAGAAQELTEALLVNPFDTRSVAQAMERALQMPLLERVQRHRAMLKRLRSHNIQWWHQRFLFDLFACQNHVFERTGS
ncbi:trehalose-6-phosphate synthase [Acidovorax sp. CCYZU-2555]|uniref:alpha,alpha-trehalose-phosphate synthase (UDP-forming) n=1 Tax=Acidovorax sp. CCYZU-2555 TaxID=2835042 RepID=UPI001BD06D91|nr:trehalose-6-phosphate synthase [Acidovorax sp. CCYZU-2555]MBS7777519.1 trehalose-6-phosphate synthase [Acidovorax sp. CCYZU-2555]